MRISNLMLLGLLSLGGLVACSDSGPKERAKEMPEVAEAVADKQSIQWYSGSVDEAFAEAKLSGKPVLLYWGAVWCPPCNQLKATIFKEQNFIAKTRLFIPVYLDGDLPNAQEQGEKFGVLGYPTLIVLSPNGQEITRIPGGLELERYASVLDMSLGAVRPVKASFERVMAGESVSDDDFHLLAYYSWGQDNERVLSEENTAEAFYALYDAAPAHLAATKSRLYLNYLSYRLGSLAEDEHLSLAEQEEALAVLQAVLADQDQANTNYDFLTYEAGSTFAQLKEVESDGLRADWLSYVARQGDNDKLSLKERLGPLSVDVQLARLAKPEGELDAALIQKVQDRLAWVETQIHNDYEREAVANSAVGIMYRADMLAEAEAFLLRGMERAMTPFYYMTSLADLAQEDERFDEAINWYARAYNESKGAATRLQWGSYYLKGLTDMKPEDHQAIKDQTMALLSELDVTGNAYSQRNGRVLKRMSEFLLAWSEAAGGAEVIADLQAYRDSRCVQLVAQSDAKSRCEAFLANKT